LLLLLRSALLPAAHVAPDDGSIGAKGVLVGDSGRRALPERPAQRLTGEGFRILRHGGLLSSCPGLFEQVVCLSVRRNPPTRRDRFASKPHTRIAELAGAFCTNFMDSAHQPKPNPDL